jgi:hypothetical protein
MYGMGVLVGVPYSGMWPRLPCGLPWFGPISAAGPFSEKYVSKSIAYLSRRQRL